MLKNLGNNPARFGHYRIWWLWSHEDMAISESLKKNLKWQNLWCPHMLSSWGHNCFTCPRGRGLSETKCHEDEDSMRTPDLLSSRTRTRGRGSQACAPHVWWSMDCYPMGASPLRAPVPERSSVLPGHVLKWGQDCQTCSQRCCSGFPACDWTWSAWLDMTMTDAQSLNP